jgi:hypothetical protein
MKTSEEAEALYNDWAKSYEADLCQEGYRIPGHIATVFTRFIPIEASPILDAGCGGGHQAEALGLSKIPRSCPFHTTALIVSQSKPEQTQYSWWSTKPP